MKCPHNKKVEEVKKMGIRVYQHEDGTSCTLLNTGALSLNRLNKTYVASHNPEIQSNYVKATITDSAVREYVVNKIGGMGLEEVKDALYSLHNAKRLSDDLIVELYNNYGPPMGEVLSTIGIASLLTPAGSTVNNYYTRAYGNIFSISNDFENGTFKTLKSYEGVKAGETVDKVESEEPPKEEDAEELTADDFKKLFHKLEEKTKFDADRLQDALYEVAKEGY